MVNRLRPLVFYGWYIVAVGALAQLVIGGAQAYAIGVFLKPMTTDLGWSRESFSAVQTVATVVMGCVGFVIGGVVDRRGPRVLLLVGGAITGAALVATSLVHEPWQFWLLRGVAQTLGSALAGNLVVNITIAKWFVVRRGMAIATASLGLSAGGIVITPLTAMVVDGYGWRAAWVVLGVVVWVVMIPCVWLVRATPEHLGLHPDGMSPEEATAYAARRRSQSAASEIQWTRAEAIRTRTIWMITVAYGLGGIGIGALFLHLIPFLIDNGFSSHTAALLFGTQAWSSVISKPIWGALMDRFHARILGGIGLLSCAVSLLLMPPAAATGSVLVFGAVLVVYGFGVGGMLPLQETVWASYFGRRHIGSIRSVGMPFSIVFGAGGPLFAGTMYDRTGTYAMAFVSFAVVQAIGAALLLMARPPQHPAEHPATRSA